MKKNRISMMVMMAIVFFSVMIVLANKSVEASQSDIYDIVLFWGQSNMAGWPTTGGKMPNGFENLSAFSKDTDIDEDILFFTQSTSKVTTPLQEGTAYIYKYTKNSFDEITSNMEIIGDGLEPGESDGQTYDTSRGGLTYNPSTGKLEKWSRSGYVSIEVSPNVNMIPEFCRTYYERTGHKVIAVTGAVGGVGIQYFLPHDDPNYRCYEGGVEYMYEAIKENFNGAVKLANAKGYKVGNKYWVCCQGESDLGTTQYETYFTQVKNNMKRDLGITMGAIVETSHEIGNASVFEKMQQMHTYQENLIKNNSDIILGSSFDYDHYVPDEANYNSDRYITKKYIDKSGNKLPYAQALEMAKKCVCAEYKWYEEDSSNIVHLHSASLSQMGRDAANSLADAQYEIIGKNVRATFHYMTGEVTLTSFSGGGMGELDPESFQSYVNNYCGAENIRLIRFAGPVRLAENSSGMFANLPNLRSFYNMNFVLTQNVTNFSRMFQNCPNLVVLSLGDWNMGKATNTSYMFQGCHHLLSVNVEPWETSNIVNMAGMFQECRALDEVDMSNWDMSKVTDTTNMFQNCSSMVSIYTPKNDSNQTITLPTNQWYNGSDTNDNELYSELRKGMFTTSVHLKKIVDYRITYHLEGGSVTGNPETYNALSNFTLKNPTRSGYTFDGWTGSNGTTKQKTVSIQGKKVTGALSYTANWVASKDTTYKIKHWRQNLDGNADNHDESNYTLVETESRAGQTGASIEAPTKTYTGFTAPNEETITIGADGNTEVNYYYTRNRYRVTLTKDEGIESVSGANEYAYEQEVTIDATVKNDYIWRNWTGAQNFENRKNTFTMPGQNIELRANTIKKASVTTKFIDQNTGNEIAEAVVEEGYEGKEYTTTERKIDGYELVKIEGSPEGRMTGNITVTYVMAKSAKLEIHYIDQTNDKTIADTKIINGYVGKEYDVKPMQINGYQHSYSSDNTAGEMAEETIQIYFGYLKQTGVNVKYVDIHTKEEIAEAKHYDCLATEKYDVTNDYQEIDGFTFIENSGNTTGIMQNEGIDVIYAYAYNTSIEVHYYDVFTNQEIADSEEIKGYEGKEYDVPKKEIKGYRFTKMKDAKGNMKREKTDLNAYYTKQTSLQLNYLDYYTKEPIREAESIEGLQGENYDVTEKVDNVEGYQLFQRATNAKGKMGAEKIEITNYYVKKLVVVVKYVDIDTKKEIADRKEYHYVAGDSYDLKRDIEKIEGYEYVSANDETKGKLEKNDVTVELSYRKQQKASGTNSDKNNSSNNQQSNTNNPNGTNSNKTNQNSSANTTNQNSGKDNTTFKGNIPKAGGKVILLPVIGIMALVSFKLFRNYKKYRDIDKQ